jgi:excisionase family DNA binding protein
LTVEIMPSQERHHDRAISGHHPEGGTAGTTEPQDGAWALSPLLRPNDVARLLSVSRAWVYEAARTGRIPSFRLGGEDGPLRFVAEDIERWLAEARGGWLPCRNDRPRPETPNEHSEDATDTAGGSVVPIRGQQSLL